MDWLNLVDWLAYFILTVTYVTVVVPIIGEQLSAQNTSYIDSLKIGAIVHLCLAVFAVILISFVWALARTIY